VEIVQLGPKRFTRFDVHESDPAVTLPYVPAKQSLFQKANVSSFQLLFSSNFHTVEAGQAGPHFGKMLRSQKE
jgi:hypothetical protein